MNYSFIILNYNTFDETRKCINHIKKIDNAQNKLNIIVIDNSSSDNSLEKLFEEYSNDNMVEIISMEYNVGFAKGNNLGYTIAKYKYNS
ncbi:glycosyltransferase, partial [Enterococcus faecium]